MLTKQEVRENFTIIDGTILRDGRVAFCAIFDAAMDTGVHIAMVLYCDRNGQWTRGVDYNFEPVGIAEDDRISGGLWLLGREGQFVQPQAGPGRQFIDDDNPAPGPFRRLLATPAGLLALGGDYGVWKFAGGEWVGLGASDFVNPEHPVDEDAFLDQVMDDTEIAFGLACAETESICLVGTGGLIRSWNGRDWVAIDSPTNANLYDVCASAEGTYTAVGRHGLIVEGRTDNWRVIETGGISVDFCGITWFDDRRYLVDGSQLYSLHSDGISPIAIADHEVPVRRLISETGRLIAFSGKFVAASPDGTLWEFLI